MITTQLIRNAKLGLALVATSAALYQNAHAEDFLIGTHGPKSWQLDDRITYSEKHDSAGRLDTLAHTTVVKYWSGDKLGMFGIGSLPYRWMSKGNASSEGFGDLMLKAGPRGKFDFGDKGSFHWITFTGLSFPTGDENVRPSLGSGGLDIKVGSTTTYLTSDKRNELTTSFEYTIPEEKTGKNIPDDISGGFIFGRQLTPKIRLGVGMTGSLKNGGASDGNYALNARIMARYNLSKDWHLQFLGEQTIAEKNISHGFTTGLFVRYNF